jgi:hypothetical protein
MIMIKLISLVTLATLFVINANAENILLVAGEKITIKSGQPLLVIGQSGEHFSTNRPVAYCEMKVGALNFEREIYSGDIFSFDVSKAVTTMVDPNSREAFEYSYSLLTDGEVALPKNILTFDQFKAFIESTGISIKSWPKNPTPVLEFQLVSEKSNNVFTATCRNSAGTPPTINQALEMIANRGVFKPDPQL